MAAIMVNGLNENDEEEDGIDFEAEAEQAFQRLANASSNYDKPQPRIIHPELPSCISNSKTPFPCLICGRSFPDVSSIQKHAKTHEYHRSPTQSDEEKLIESKTCCYCGQFFSSGFAKLIHQSTGAIPWSCHHCQEIFEMKDDLKRHLCSKLLGLSSEELPFRCPLGCDNRYSFNKSDMTDHLEALHGCSSKDIAYKDVGNTEQVIVHNMDNSEPCTNCGAVINTSCIPYKTHLLCHCHARGMLQTELLNSYKDLSKQSGFDLETLGRLEMQAYANECDDIDCNDEPRIQNGCDLASQAPRKEDVNMAKHLMAWKNHLEQSLPHGHNHRIIEIHRQIRKRLKNDQDDWNKNYIDYEDVDTEMFEEPRQEVLERLEKELGFKILNIRVQDILPFNLSSTSDVLNL